MDRRTFLRSAAAAGFGLSALDLLTACSSSEGGGGGGGGGSRAVTLGFIPLTDCAPLVVALEKGYFAARDLDVTLENGKSWPGVRDKLISGEFDGAHALFSLPLSVATGVSTVEGLAAGESTLRVAMMLNANGQGLTLASDLAAAGYGDPEQAADVIRSAGAKSFGMTFPGGTHDLWLRYWMRAGGLDPVGDGLDLKPIPPPDMFANLNQENVRGYSVGEPWNARAVVQGKGFTTLATQDLWLDHPEKALVVNETFATERRDVLKDVMLAVIEAQTWLDDPANAAETADLIGVQKYVNATPEEIADRLAGVYELGAGLDPIEFGERRMRFYGDGGAITVPRRGHQRWAMAQYVRLGLLDELPPTSVADDIILADLFEEVAGEVGIDVPDDLAPFDVVLDGATFDPADPAEEAARP